MSPGSIGSVATARSARRFIAVAVCFLAVGFPASASRSQSRVYSIRTLGPVEPPPSSPRVTDEGHGFEARWLQKDGAPPPWLSMYRLTAPDVENALAGGTVLSGLSDLRSRLLPDLSMAAPAESAFALATAVDDREATGLKAIAGRGERWHLLRFDSVASSRPLDARLTAFGQVPYVTRTAEALAFEPETSYEPAVLGVAGEAGGFEIGAQYRSLGKWLDRVVSGTAAKRDQEGNEMWLARRFGVVRLRVSQSELSDNVDRNPALPRTTRAQTGLTAEIAMEAWPVFSLGYSGGDAERTRPGVDGRHLADRESFETMTATAYYPGNRWDVTASTTYTSSRPLAARSDIGSGLYHDLVMALRPSDSVTVMPAVSIGHEHYEGSGSPWDTGSASVTVSVAPPGSRWNAWTTMAYTASRAGDRSIDSAGHNLSGGIGWDLGRLLAGRGSLSVEAGYDQYQDRSLASTPSRGLFAFVLFKITGF